MDWILRSPQVHSTFGNLGHTQADGYHVHENCDEALDTILQNILLEDKSLRLFRRSINFSQNFDKDLIPLLLNVKEDKTAELLIRILADLTVPTDCLLDVDVLANTDLGGQIMYELNHLLQSAKNAFADKKVTRVIIDFLNKNLESENGSLSMKQCTNIVHCMLLLKNILHIPHDSGNPNSVQNQILWNIFSQSIDKVLIKLITIPEATNWVVTMVQLISLLYKDQHVATLQTLLDKWIETAVSQSSEDNESNTSPNPTKGTENSSLMLTSDPRSGSSQPDSDKRMVGVESGDGTGNSSDSADDASTQGAGAGTDNPPFETTCWTGVQQINVPQKDDPRNTKDNQTKVTAGAEHSQNTKNSVNAESSDSGYGTQIETQQSISTSSNESGDPFKKPLRPKRLILKKKSNNKEKTNYKEKTNNKKKTYNKACNAMALHNRKRKFISIRAKSNIMAAVQAPLQATPSDDDISDVLKEFTIDFLLKGYNKLIKTLLSEILTNLELKIDSSHFFWLLTYFLNFATRLELDWDDISSVLSYETVSYLAAQGVNLCEQFELAIRLDSNDLKPALRRVHLMIKAVREVAIAAEAYEKLPHLCDKGKTLLATLTLKMSKNEELRSLFILLLRFYNKDSYTKHFLKDLVVTNFSLLSFLDRVLKRHHYNSDMREHLRQFATPEVMQTVGDLLEDYLENGQMVNDCIFTLMHHVAGTLGSVVSLLQPHILTTFTSIWMSRFEICDDWKDMIEYTINTFVKKPVTLRAIIPVRLATECFEDNEPGAQSPNNGEENKPAANEYDQGGWSEKEVACLTWHYMRSKTCSDLVTELVNSLKEGGINRSRNSVVSELYRQNIIDQNKYKDLLREERSKNGKIPMPIHLTKEMREEEIKSLCEQLRCEEKSKALDWLQKVLLDTCLAKIYFEKKAIQTLETKSGQDNEAKFHSKIFGKDLDELPAISSVAWLAFVCNHSVPLVPWNTEQDILSKDLKFLRLADKLGFLMPVDTGKIFVRIPNYWTSEYLYELASVIAPVDKAKLKFSLSDISGKTYLPPMMNNSPHKYITTKIPSYYQTNEPKLPTALPSSSSLPAETSSNWLEIVKRSQKMSFNPGGIPSTKANSEASEPCMSPGEPKRSRTSLYDDGGCNKRSSSSSFATATSSNWLEIVKRSRKISFNPGGIPLTKANSEASEPCMSPGEPKRSRTSLYDDGDCNNRIPSTKANPEASEPCMSPGEPKRSRTSLYDDGDCNKSFCETASVACHLNRMQVSDEEDKPDIRPRSSRSASDGGSAGKRRRRAARRRIRFPIPY